MTLLLLVHNFWRAGAHRAARRLRRTRRRVGGLALQGPRDGPAYHHSLSAARSRPCVKQQLSLGQGVTTDARSFTKERPAVLWMCAKYIFLPLKRSSRPLSVVDIAASGLSGDGVPAASMAATMLARAHGLPGPNLPRMAGEEGRAKGVERAGKPSPV